MKLTCPCVTIDISFIFGQIGYSGSEIIASNELQWKKSHFYVLHSGDDRHLHDGLPNNLLKEVDVRQRNDDHTIRVLLSDDERGKWWHMEKRDDILIVIPMTIVVALRQTAMVWAVSFDVSIWIFSVVSEPGNYLMLFFIYFEAL